MPGWSFLLVILSLVAISLYLLIKADDLETRTDYLLEKINELLHKIDYLEKNSLKNPKKK